jgi:hypothetical protein
MCDGGTIIILLLWYYYFTHLNGGKFGYSESFPPGCSPGGTLCSCLFHLRCRISRKNFLAGSCAGLTTDREIVRLIRRADPARIRLESMGLTYDTSPSPSPQFLITLFDIIRCCKKKPRSRVTFRIVGLTAPRGNI